MSNYEFDEVFSNIEISNDLKKELFENCKKGRRTADFRMRHAGTLTALLIIATVGCTGLGSYAMYDSVSSRMAAMSAEEKTGYVEELSLDRSVTISDSYSRELSDEEILRAAELEKKYNEQVVLPAESAKRVEKLSDWDGESVCFVEEDGKLHIPEGELTDSQLLQFIDHNEKRDYVMEEEAKKNYIEEDSPYINVDAATEKDVVDIAYGHLKFFLGEDIGNGFANVAHKVGNLAFHLFLMLGEPLQDGLLDIVLTHKAPHMTCRTDGYDMFLSVVFHTAYGNYQVSLGFHVIPHKAAREPFGQLASHSVQAVLGSQRIGHLVNGFPDHLGYGLLVAQFARTGKYQHYQPQQHCANQQPAPLAAQATNGFGDLVLYPGAALRADARFGR